MNLLEVRLDKLVSILGTDLDNGLTTEQVLRNRREFGENILFEKKNTVLSLMKKIFGDVIMILFILICFFDFLETGKTVSLISIILVSVFYSAFVLCAHFYVSSVQKNVEKFSKSKYHVRRSGHVRSVPKSDLVPGDILLLEKGDVMPCDGIILKQSAVKILEASVTGRRVPIFKRTHEEVELEENGYPYFECILFAGSVILHGSVKVFVCNTGRDIFDNENFTISRQNTTVPRIYHTALDLKKQISLVWVIACFFLFAIGVFYNRGVFHSFQYAIALLIAVFPDSIEHLSDLAIGHMTKKLFAEGVVLRNPGAVDRLSNANCVFVNSSDYLFYSKPIPNSFYLGEEHFEFKESAPIAAPLLENLILAQDSSEYFSSKREEWYAEKAIMSAAAHIGIQKRRLDREFLYINHYDFEAKHGFSCSLVLHQEKYRLVIRGNPNAVIACCSEIYRADGETVPMHEVSKVSLRANARHLAGICERIVAVAVLGISSPSTGDQRKLCRGMTYLGMFGLSTPISAASANAVSTCQKAGVQTYLLTDDYPETVSALSKSVSIIGEGDYQYALPYRTYQRMDQGVFVADIEKYKAYCGFPAEEKQSIVQFHKDNGDITLSLTGGIYDTLPQMESDVSVVSADEKLNCVRLNSDILVREKKYELVPLCINWSRIFYRNIVHIMQYILLVQVALGASVLLSFLLTGKEPYHYFPMLITGIAAIVLSGINLFHRLPGPHLEDNKEVLKDDRVASLQVLVIVPFIMGVTQAIAALLSKQISLYASGGVETASSAALMTFLFSSYFSSLSIKFDKPLITCFKNLGKTELVSAVCNVFFALLLCATPIKSLWQTQESGSGFSFWIWFFVFVLSLLPAIMMEWMKFLKNDVSAFGEKHNIDEKKGEVK